MKYMSDDGITFATEAECIAYENNPSNRLFTFVTKNIESKYNEDAGWSAITEGCVAAFIETHFKEICEILGSPKEESEGGQKEESAGWISNVGRRVSGYPDTLRPTSRIEVKSRSGSTDIGDANEWSVLWADDGAPADIVAYRVLKG